MVAPLLSCTDTYPHHHPVPTAPEWYAGVVYTFAHGGSRLTAARQGVLEWIAQVPIPFTAETIVADLKDQQGLSSRATIYRMVEWLCANGWIVRVQSDQVHNTYIRLLPGHHHTLICTQCGSSIIIGGCGIEELLASAVADTDFEVHGHMLELYGYCKECRTALREVS